MSLFCKEDIKIWDFDESEIVDIREICLQDARDEVDALRSEITVLRMQCDDWKNCYESAMDKINKFCKQ